MENSCTNAKSCPVCGVAMARVASDDSVIVHRCYACLTEVVKPVPRTRERRRIITPQRRSGIDRDKGSLHCRNFGFASALAAQSSGGWHAD